MLISKHDLDKGDVRVAGGGTTALGIISTVLGGLALGTEGLGGGLLGGRRHLLHEEGCGDAADRHIRRREADLLTALSLSESKRFTEEKSYCLEEKMERHFGHKFEKVFEELCHLKTFAAVDKATEEVAAKYQAEIGRLKYYIDQLQDAQYVKKIYGSPMGGRFVPCCCHEDECHREEHHHHYHKNGNGHHKPKE